MGFIVHLVMKKYSPSKLADDVVKSYKNSIKNNSMNESSNNFQRAPDASQSMINSNVYSPRIAEDYQGGSTYKQRSEYSPQNEESVSNLYRNERGEEPKKQKDDSFSKKYEAILQKYNKENYAKEKYRGMTTDRDVSYREVDFNSF